MKKLYQRLAEQGFRPGIAGGEPRLSLAAFGKHPGWDDHIPGIGVETEMLARLKSVLYVEGIGKQIDSGAWEKLEVDKRLEGFDHTFLWIWAERTMAGLLWSSTDRKGRSKYPMVLCVEAQSVSPAFIIKSVIPGLRRLAQTCRVTTSADQVVRDCQTAQNELRTLLATPEAKNSAPWPSMESRQAFLNHPETGPEQLGFMRTLHELGMIPALLNGKAPGHGTEAARNSEHLRLPRADNSTDDALLLWAAFLGCAVAETTPLLLLGRAETNYVEAIVGEPVAGDFFCLQTTPAAQPLVTEIPYHLSMDAPQQLGKVVSRFLDRPEEPVKGTRSPIPPQVGDAEHTAQEKKPARKSGWLFGAAILLAAMAAVPLLLPGGKYARPEGLASSPRSARTAESPRSDTLPTNTQSETGYASENSTGRNREFQMLTNAAYTAFRNGELTNVIVYSDRALDIEPNHPAIIELKNQVQANIQRLLTDQQRHGQFQSLTNAALLAFRNQDYTNAIAQSDKALGIEPNHPAIIELKDQAQAKIKQLLTDQQRQRQLQSLRNAALIAFHSQDYTNAIAQLEKALELDPNQPAILELKNQAQAKMNELLTAQARQKEFQRFTNAAWTAFQKRDFTNTIVEADKALALESNHPAPASLKQLANAQIIEVLAAQKRQREFQRLTNAAWMAFQRKDYSQTVAESDKALVLTPNHAAVLGLKARAEDSLKVQSALATPLAESPGVTLERLDAELETLRVWFNLLNPKDAHNPRAQKARRLPGGIGAQKEQYLSKVASLESEYGKGGWLQQNNREIQLRELKTTIRHWE